MKRGKKLLCLLLMLFVTALLPVTARAAATFEAGQTYGATVLWSPGQGQTIDDWAAFTTPVPGMSCVVSSTTISIYGTPTTPGTYTWSTEVYCSSGASTVTFTVVVTGHTWGAWGPTPVAVPPTCTEGGTEARTCTGCGEVEMREVGPLGHDWGAWQTGGDGVGIYHQPPTCTDAGEEYRVCSRCGQRETRTVPALGHAWDGGVVSKEPTCTEAGSADYKCTRCGETETRAVPVLGHDWEKSETIEPQGLHDGKTVYTCRRCGETKEELIPVVPANFFAALRNLPLDGGGSDLVITRQPQGGVIDRDGGETVTLTVEVAGGVPPYTYEWHCESLEEEDKSTPLTVSAAAAGADLDAAYQSAASSWYGAHVGTYADVFNSGWLSAVTEAAGGGSAGSLLGSLSVFDKNLGSSEGPEYEAARGNCSYWVEVFDGAGNSVKSEGAWIIYKLRIARQPRSVNWQAEVDEDLQAVFLECQAADGTGEYRYEWFKDNDFSVPYDTHERIGVTDLGTYVCRVTDVRHGDVVESESVEVYDETPFKIVGINAWGDLWPEEEAELAAWCSGGVPPYEVWWDHEGTPLLTQQGADRDGCPAFYAVSTAGGLYTVHATDSVGATDISAVYRYDKKLTITQQPVGGTLPLNGSVEVGVTVADGEGPYRYVLYRNGTASMQKTTDGVFQVWYPGEYCIRVEDSRGHYVVSDHCWVENEKFRVTDCSATAEITEYGRGARLFIEVAGGAEPYTHEWLELTDHGWESYELGAQSAFYAWRPGTYACRVTDADGNTRYREMEVSYSGDRPVILRQPESGYMEDSAPLPLLCRAASGSGDGSLSYHWEWSSDGTSWYLLQDGGQSILAATTGYYRCRVTDAVTEKYVYSDVVAVSQKLKCTFFDFSSTTVPHHPYDIECFVQYDISGGTGSYTLRAYQQCEGCSRLCYERYTHYSSGFIFVLPSLKGFIDIDSLKWIVVTEDTPLYFVVIDDNGQRVQSDLFYPDYSILDK